jgi:beta-lactam-binding protein with PASTA domain
MKKEFFEKHPLVKHLLYMLGVSVVIVVLAFLLIKVIARQGKEYELPDIYVVSLQELESNNPLHFKYVVIDSVYHADKEGGLVVQQDPKAGTMVKTHRKIYVTVTTYAPADVVLPELSNMTVRSAVSALEAAGLRCGKLRFVDSPYRNVILEATCKGKMVYAGEKMDQGAVVDLTVGMGEKLVGSRVPFVIGQSPAKARRGILSASLNVGQEHFEEVTDRNSAVCYRLSPDYTGVTRYPLGTYVEVWYCDATEEDVERIISNFKVDSSKIVHNEYDLYEAIYPEEGGYDFDEGWDW